MNPTNRPQRNPSVVILLVLLSLALTSGCGPESGTKKPPSGDVWSIYRQNPQHTGRTVYYGPDESPVIKWSFASRLNGLYYVAVNEGDGTIYATADTQEGLSLLALGTNGKLKWKHRVAGSWHDPPAIGKEGTVYVGGLKSTDPGIGSLIAVDPTGKQAWTFEAPSIFSFVGPVVGEDGTIYFAGNQIYALNANGKLKWAYNGETAMEQQRAGQIFYQPVLGEDGTVYATGNSPVKPPAGPDINELKPKFNYKLYALTPKGKLKWATPIEPAAYPTPVIAGDGTIYVPSKKLYAISPQGKKKWEFNAASSDPPAVAEDGTLYYSAAPNQGKGIRTLFALDPTGREKWKFIPTGEIASPPVVDGNGIIYVIGGLGSVTALNPDGTEKWEKDLAIAGSFSEPVIMKDGVLLVNDGMRLHALTGK
ncbi:MAG: outer membrane protein assembly factor BamB family protein [Candidatus Aquicultorales bacterium]